MPRDEQTAPEGGGYAADPFTWEEHFFGAVTVGERGQVVIPAEARRRFRIEPGDKVLILADPAKRALMLCKIDSLREFMNAFQEGLARVEREHGQVTEGTPTPTTEGGAGEDEKK
jgi:AbrB family looped-hinge helix DNA binding protein